MSGDVGSSGKGVDSNLIEACNDDVGSTGQDGRGNAGVEAQSDGIEVCIGIHEGLEEIVDASDEIMQASVLPRTSWSLEFYHPQRWPT